MILSALTPKELCSIISSGNAKMLTQVKGIGPKAAQRILVDLGDKIMALADDTLQAGTQSIVKGNTILCSEVADEATQALTMLGFSPAPTSKVVHKILSEEPDAPVEKVIKLALKML
jgi:Holliday junction DNA helicase RuvA